ncbi:tyrosine-type recombinase/integrase [Nocardia puris]|uniref:Site-specific recombinase XerD n=1 Tax=Nocardia puris TaxID=208602 RepID=A0A366E3X1_9NOCA|nr:site-specific integrase [Nocardia puris]RBO97070.1 site-specific recombinase XerD [Nocardia puris]
MADKKPARKKSPNGSGNISARKDGRYELKLFVDTPDGTRKRISVYGATWEEADAERTRLKELQRKGIPVDVTTMTVAQYLRYWLTEVAEPKIRRTTFATYEGDVRLHLIPGLGKRKLRALDSRHVRTFITGLRTKCQCCAQGKDAKRAKPRCCAKSPATCCGDVLSISSVRHVLRVLRAALQDAVDDELISRNVARPVKVSDVGEHKVRAFTRVEARRFLQVAEDHRLHALWAVALSMGLRRGEALGLSWDDVDLVAGRLVVRQALHRVDGSLKLDAVKTAGSNATLPIPRALGAVLRDHRKRQLEERFAAGSRWTESGLVFTTSLGRPIEPRNMNRMFRQLCNKAGVPAVRVHDLRHSCATLLFTMGVDAATVQRILRHSSISVTTGTYVEVIESVKREALDSFDVLLASADDTAI